MYLTVRPYRANPAFRYLDDACEHYLPFKSIGFGAAVNARRVVLNTDGNITKLYNVYINSHEPSHCFKVVLQFDIDVSVIVL